VNWSSVKNLLIAILIAANVFMLYNIARQDRTRNYIDEGEVADAVELLAERGMIVPAEVIPLRMFRARIWESFYSDSYHTGVAEKLTGNAVPLFLQSDSSLYGLHTLLKPCDVELRRLIQKISDEQGYACSESTTNSILWLELGLEVNSDLAENIAEAITALLEEYDFSKMVINPSVIICCIDEQGSERCRICLNGSWDYDTAQYFNEISCLYTTEGRLESQAEAFIQWWEDADFSGYGLIKQ